MRWTHPASEDLFLCACVLAVIGMTSQAWIGGWIGFQGALVLAGYLAAGRVLRARRDPEHPTPRVWAAVKAWLTEDLRGAWPWYYGVCGLIALNFAVMRHPSEWPRSWPYVATFTLNLTRPAGNWFYNGLFSQLWIFGVMLQTALAALVAATAWRRWPRVQRLGDPGIYVCMGALVLLAAAARAVLGPLLTQIHAADTYAVGDALFWLSPTQLDAAALGFAARWFAATGPALSRRRAWVVALAAVAALGALNAATAFPLGESYQYLWAYSPLDLALAALLLAVTTLGRGADAPATTGARRTTTAPPSRLVAAAFVAYFVQTPFHDTIVKSGLDGALGSKGLVMALIALFSFAVAAAVATFSQRLGEAAKPRAQLAFTALFALFAAWCAQYVFRTSFVIDGQRVFTLWDDAMISMTYAKNLALGNGLVWYPGAEPVQGFSNLGVTLLMAAVHLVPIDELKIALVLQVISGLMLLTAVGAATRITRRLLPEQPLAPLFVLAGLFLTAPFNIWALQGSDTAFVGAFTMLLALELGAVGAGAAPRRGRIFFIAVAGTLCRMDFAAYVVIGAAYLAWTRARRAGILALTGAGLVSAGMLAFNHAYYGDWLPNTFYLKTAGNLWAQKADFTLSYAVDSLARLLPLVAAAGLGWLVMSARQRRAALPCALIAATTLAYNFWLGADWALGYESRFLMPAYPALFVLAAPGFLAAGALVRARFVRLPATALATVLLLFVVLRLTPSDETREEWLYWSAPTMFHGENAGNAKLGLLLRRATDPGTSIGIHWAGLPGYFSERPAVDFLGKCDRHIAKSEAHVYAPGHSKWDWDYVMQDARPDLISEATRGLEKRVDFKRAYEATTVEGLKFFVRKTSKYKMHFGDAAARTVAH